MSLSVNVSRTTFTACNVLVIEWCTEWKHWVRSAVHSLSRLTDAVAPVAAALASSGTLKLVDTGWLLVTLLHVWLTPCRPVGASNAGVTFLGCDAAESSKSFSTLMSIGVLSGNDDVACTHSALISFTAETAGACIGSSTSGDRSFQNWVSIASGSLMDTVFVFKNIAVFVQTLSVSGL